MKRVYKQVTTRPAEGGWGIALDGRAMRTPGKNELVVPSEALAAAIAAEWDAQRDEIRPGAMPLTRLAATAIDRTARAARPASSPRPPIMPAPTSCATAPTIRRPWRRASRRSGSR